MDDHEKAWATDAVADFRRAHPRMNVGALDDHEPDLEEPMPDETLITDPKTGGVKGVKLARFDLLPWGILRELAEHFGRGARKYASRNWERGYAWSLSYGALHRHLESFWSGDEIDHDESLYTPDEPHTARHIIAVVWHACVLAYFSRFGVGTDDRPVLNDQPVAKVESVLDDEYEAHYLAAQERSPLAGPRAWRTMAIAELDLKGAS